MSKWSELYFPSKGHCTGAAENSVIYKNPLSGRVELMSLRRVHANAGQLRLSLKDDLIALSWKLRKTVFAITSFDFVESALRPVLRPVSTPLSGTGNPRTIRRVQSKTDRTVSPGPASPVGRRWFGVRRTGVPAAIRSAFSGRRPCKEARLR